MKPSRVGLAVASVLLTILAVVVGLNFTSGEKRANAAVMNPRNSASSTIAGHSATAATVIANNAGLVPRASVTSSRSALMPSFKPRYTSSPNTSASGANPNGNITAPSNARNENGFIGTSERSGSRARRRQKNINTNSAASFSTRFTAIQLGLVTSGEATGSVRSSHAASARSPSALPMAAAAITAISVASCSNASPKSQAKIACRGDGSRASGSGILRGTFGS